MANTDKNILITPNIGSATDEPVIVFSGADSSTAAQDIIARTYSSSNGTLSFEGSAGQLFSISNDLTGTIFSVNDVSGIPSIEVNADGNISLAEFSGNVGIGTSSPGEKLEVSGNLKLAATTGGWYPDIKTVYASENGDMGYVGWDNSDALRLMNYSLSNTELYTNGAVRLTIDGFGNVYIGNPAFGGAAKITSDPVNSIATYGDNAGNGMTLADGGGMGFNIGYSTQMSLSSSGVLSVGDPTIGVAKITGGFNTATYGDQYNNYWQFDNTNEAIRGFMYNHEVMRVDYLGNAHFDGDVTAYSNTISDERLKENIVGIDGALDKVSQLNGYTFNYKADGKVSAGVIAQEVEKVLPEAVSEKELPLKVDDGEQYKVVNYDALHGLLIEAIKELKAEIAELKAAK